MKKFLIAAVVFFVLVVIIVTCAVNSGNGKPSPTSSTSSSASTSVPISTPKQSTPAKTLKWVTTHTFSGNGTKKTEVFTVPGEWKVGYTCKGMGDGINANFSADIYNSDGTIHDMGTFNVICKDGKTTSDTTEEHNSSGSVYLDVTADSDWTVTVQELK